MSQFYESLKLMGLIPQIGLVIVLSIILSALMGHCFDRLFGIEPICLLVGIVLGVLLGFIGAYRLLIRGMLNERVKK